MNTPSTQTSVTRNKSGRPPGKSKGKGFSTGGSYASPASITVSSGIDALRQETADPSGTSEPGHELLKSLLVFSEEQILDLLLPELLQTAAQRTFPQEAGAILQLYDFSLRIGWFRQRRAAKQQSQLHDEELLPPSEFHKLGYALLRSQEDVRTKLLTDDVPALHQAITQLQTAASPTPERLLELQARVRLRLANILYYAVQMLAHDLWRCIQEVVRHGLSSEQFLEACQQAMTTFSHLVQQYSAEAQTPPPLGFRKAVLKFALRSASGEKVDDAELLLMRY